MASSPDDITPRVLTGDGFAPLGADATPPPVHPLLIEHLRAVFALHLHDSDPRNPNYRDEVLSDHERQKGQQQVIDYLETITTSRKEIGSDVFPRTETEDTGADPRRPRARAGR